MAIVSLLSKMQLCGLPTMSDDTSGSSEYSSTPFSGPGLAAAAYAALTASTVAGVFRTAMKSVIEPSGTGTRSDGAVELALHGLEHEPRGAGGAGRRGHDVDGGGPGPAEVLVRTVDQHLVAGVGVHRGHQALLHAEGVVEHLDQRHEAVGGARRVGDDLVVGWGRTCRR